MTNYPCEFQIIKEGDRSWWKTYLPFTIEEQCKNNYRSVFYSDSFSTNTGSDEAKQKLQEKVNAAVVIYDKLPLA